MDEPWPQFLADVPWFANGSHWSAEPTMPPGQWQAASAEFTTSFPLLSTLLTKAIVTRVRLDSRERILYSWELPDGRVRSWLCLPATQDTPPICPEHRLLLASFGGIVERSNEAQESWLLNHNEVITPMEAGHDATFVNDYGWAFEGFPTGIPVDLRAYYSIAREANGNITLCHRTMGDVLLFAPDHAFHHVVPLEGCPDYTFYRIPEAPTFVDWVAAVSLREMSCLGLTW